MQSAPSDTALMAKLVAATSLITTHATSHGMTLTFADDKSAVLLCPLCAREPNGILEHDAHGAPGFWISDEIKGTRHFLPVVDAYKHLGTIAVSNVTPGVEVSYRLSKADGDLSASSAAPFFGQQGTLANSSHFAASFGYL